MAVKVGDKVQIKGGGIDVTNYKKATAGKMYGEGGPLWATVVAVVENWYTAGNAGLAQYVTKVRCVGVDGSTVVWQVRPEDIAGQVITEEPAPAAPEEPPAEDTPAPAAEEEAPVEEVETTEPPPEPVQQFQDFDVGASGSPYAPPGSSADWSTGYHSSLSDLEIVGNPGTLGPQTPTIPDSMFAYNASYSTPYYVPVEVRLRDQKDKVPRNMKQLGIPYKAKYLSSWDSLGRRQELLNKVPALIQNAYGFPRHITNPEDVPDQYDYTQRNTDSLENKLKEVRATLGIQVHGSNDIARSVKYYMYNRFKTPDTNLAFNRTITHIFFTRPDLYLLKSGQDAVGTAQTNNHTDTALLLRKNPSLFKLLTNNKRCYDSNNFNMLLSNQIASFQLSDEELAVTKAGKSWQGHEMQYGQMYTGRTAGEITCEFTETSDFSITHLIKIWMTYIDNISSGAWSPNYGTEDGREFAHARDRALDYAASMYVFKCGPDGEDVLYWSKYYGIFPISSGTSALGWQRGSSMGDTPTLSIRFAYSYKKDMSPISLVEFNANANLSGDQQWIPAWSNYPNHSIRPYVGCPYIELNVGRPTVSPDDTHRATKETSIRLKFKLDPKARESRFNTSKQLSRGDVVLYKTGSGDTSNVDYSL